MACVLADAIIPVYQAWGIYLFFKSRTRKGRIVRVVDICKRCFEVARIEQGCEKRIYYLLFIGHFIFADL